MHVVLSNRSPYIDLGLRTRGGVKPVNSVGSVLDTFISRISRHRIMSTAKMLSLYNRVQGTRELLDAAYMLEGLLLEKLPDNVDVELIEYSTRGLPGWLEPPAGWHLEEAVIKIDGKALYSSDRPLIAAPHSPPSDGWVRGEAVVIKDPLDPKSYEGVEGKIAVIGGNHRIAYRHAVRRGAAAVVFYREDLPGDAIPYIGLFLPPREAKSTGVPAFSIPNRLVRGINGSIIEAYMDSNVLDSPKFPVVVAWSGDRKGRGPLITAHYCHPSPGANDNASGVAGAIEAFKLLVELDPEATYRLALIPEYTGSITVLSHWLSDVTSSMVNLDMIGGRPEKGVGAISVYLPSMNTGSRLASISMDAGMILYSRLGWMPTYRYYGGGSDHDVGLALGVESIMVNQWPDPYYHSDWDDIDRLDPNQISRVVLLAALTIYLDSSGYDPVNGDPRTGMIIASHTARGDELSSKLAMEVLRGEPAGSGWMPIDDERMVKPEPLFMLDPLLHGFSLDEATILSRILTGQRSWNALARELFYHAAEGASIAVLHSKLAAIYGVDAVPMESFVETIRMYINNGVLRVY